MARRTRAQRKAAKSSRRTSRKVKRTERKKVRQEKVKKFVQKAKQIGGFTILAPFKKLMINALNSQGIKVSSKAPLADIAKLFFQNIVRRDSFDENTHFGHGNTMLVSDEYVYLPDDVTRVDSIDPVTITTIVTSIVKYIKTVRDRKKAGEPITPIQEKVADLSDKVDAEVQAQTDAQIDSEVGGFVTDNSKYLMIGAAAVLLLLIFKK